MYVPDDNHEVNPANIQRYVEFLKKIIATGDGGEASLQEFADQMMVPHQQDPADYCADNKRWRT